MLAHLSKLRPFALNATRIMVGLAYFSHGGQKLFAWFGAERTVDMMSRWGIAGIVEFFGGLLVVIGLYHRPAAFIVAGEMAVTYFWMHVWRRGDLWWWGNGGELPLVYCFIFLFIAANGGGSFSVDGWLARRKQHP